MLIDFDQTMFNQQCNTSVIVFKKQKKIKYVNKEKGKKGDKGMKGEPGEIAHSFNKSVSGRLV